MRGADLLFICSFLKSTCYSAGNVSSFNIVQDHNSSYVYQVLENKHSSCHSDSSIKKNRI